MSAHTEEFPYTLAISKAELIALVKFHTAQAKAVPTRMGKKALELRASSIFPSGRALKALHEEARAVLEVHTTRARGLLSILHP